MADEPEITVETPKEPELTVEVKPDDLGAKWQKPELTDEEVSKLSEPPPEDEIGRYAHQAQKRIKSLQIANQELRRRHTLSQKDVATATTLAEQLYRENQGLKQNVTRSEAALIDQALARAESQLNQAQVRFQQAWAAQNPGEITAANVEVARTVAEMDRLRLLKQPPAKDPDPAPSAAPQPQQDSSSPATKAWIEKNSWMKTDPEMARYAFGVHNSLASQGIGEQDGQRYWGVIEQRVREKFPERFEGNGGNKEDKKEAPKESGGRPVTVTGATRVNGQAQPVRASRHVVLSESQVRIATALGLTPEQYAHQLVKEEAMNAKERVQ